MAEVRSKIADVTLEDVRAWDVGRGFIDKAGDRPFACRGFKVPTLEEALIDFPTARFNVDAKQHTSAMVTAIVGLVRKHGAEARVRIASFDARTLRDVRRRGYKGGTGLARSEIACAALLPLRLLSGRFGRVHGDAAQVPTHAGPLRLDTPRMIARFHAQGLRVDFWTVNAHRCRRGWNHDGQSARHARHIRRTSLSMSAKHGVPIEHE
jgi:glycerophosphoryl diester phosphodiesterase